MSSPLSNRQKAYLCQLSNRVLDAAIASAIADGQDPARSVPIAIDVHPSAALTGSSDFEFGSPGRAGRNLELKPKFPSSKFRDDFRLHHVLHATGRHGLRCCSQFDYKTLEAHFLDLLGESGHAFNAHLRGETEPRRLVLFKINRRCKEYDISISKAEGICRQMTRGTSLRDADEKTLWNVFFKLRYYEPKHKEAA